MASSHLIAFVVLISTVNIVPSACDECNDAERRILQRSHTRCVQSGELFESSRRLISRHNYVFLKKIPPVRDRMLSGSEPEHARICRGLTEQVHVCGQHFEKCLDQEELR